MNDLMITADAKPLKAEDLKGKVAVFDPAVYKDSKKSNLLFTKHLKGSKDLGTGTIQYIKPRGEGEAPFLIVSFEKMEDNMGVMLGDLKEAAKASDKSPEPMVPVKASKAKTAKVTGYKLNSNAKFGWDAEKRGFIVN